MHTLDRLTCCGPIDGLAAVLAENDGRALNYMLAVANVQSALFTVGIQNSTAEDFVNQGYNESVYANIVRMQEEHKVRA